MMVAIIVMQSCTVWYPDVYYDDGIPDDYNHDMSGDVLIHPTLNMQSINFFVNSTRGLGAFDNTSYPTTFTPRYTSSRFYVLAYRRGVEQQGPYSQYADMRMLMRSPGNVNRTECLVSTDRATPAPTYHRGKPAMAKELRGILEFLDEDKETVTMTNLFWNKSVQDLPYDFTGYHIDDATINSIDAREDRTIYNITYDGTQDVMVGHAPEVTMSLLNKEFPSLSNKEQVVSINAGGYTTFGASLGVQPKINVEHMLTRLMFRAIPTASSAENIRITGVRVLGYNSGDLTVVARNFDDLGFTSTGDKVWLDLHDTITVDKQTGMAVKGDLLQPVDVSWDEEAESQKARHLGESIMLYPETSYNVEIKGVQTLKRTWDSSETFEQEFSMPLSIRYDGGKLFEPGYTYFVTFNVYGYNRIDITVSSMTWKDGGSVDLDTETTH